MFYKFKKIIIIYLLYFPNYLLMGPRKEELDAIEAEWKLDLTNLNLDEIAKEVKDEIGSNIDNDSIPWCEAAATLDDSWSSEYSELNNADTIWNTSSPYSLMQG